MTKAQQLRLWNKHAKKRGVLMTCKLCGVHYTNLKGPYSFVTSRSNRAYCAEYCRNRKSYDNRMANNPERMRAVARACAKVWLSKPENAAKQRAYAADRERWEGCGLATLSAEEKRMTYAIYEEAARLNKEHGDGAYHVDHILPRALGGAHAWWNLQILTKEENLSKSAKFRPEDRDLYIQRIHQLFDQW